MDFTKITLEDIAGNVNSTADEVGKPAKVNAPNPIMGTKPIISKRQLYSEKSGERLIRFRPKS